VKVNLTKYLLSSLFDKDLFFRGRKRGRKILGILLTIEDYFDTLVLEGLTSDEEPTPEIQWVINARKEALEKYPLCYRDFASENLRILYLLKLIYF
jgi:hypothetical protein